MQNTRKFSITSSELREAVNAVMRGLFDDEFAEMDRQEAINNSEPNFLPDQRWLKEKFEYYNRVAFGGRLPLCQLAVGRCGGQNTLGQFKVNYDKSKIKLFIDKNHRIYYDELIMGMTWGNARPLDDETIQKYCKSKITIDNRTLKSEWETQEILVHEMCHYYVFYVDKSDEMDINKGHGPIFRSVCIEAASYIKGMDGESISKAEGDFNLTTNNAVAKVDNKNKCYIVILKQGETRFCILTKEYKVIQDAYRIKDNCEYIKYADNAPEMFARLAVRHSVRKTLKKSSFSDNYDEGVRTFGELLADPYIEWHTIYSKERGIDTGVNDDYKPKERAKTSLRVVLISWLDDRDESYMLMTKNGFEKAIDSFKFRCNDSDADMYEVRVSDDQELAYYLKDSCRIPVVRDAYGSKYKLHYNDKIASRIESADFETVAEG